MEESIELKEKIRRIPKKPGVYLFKDQYDKILYIGKAKVLRDRVRTYFQESTPKNLKHISLLRKVKNVEWIVTSSEVEALLTEANLVKEYAPKYNVNLKDDKSFPYIQITNEPYPQVLLTRKIMKGGSKYFGPYTEVRTLRETLKVIHKVFPVRSCNYFINGDSIKQKKYSICLDYHIKKCQGPCEGLVSQKVYNQMIRSIIQFLHGRTNSIIHDLKEQMELASNEARYEEAALYRDQLRAVETFSNRQRKVTASFNDRDIIAIATRDSDACAVVIRLRNGRLVSREKVYLTGANSDDMEQTISDFLQQFYLDTDFVPNEIILPLYPGDLESIETWLKEKRGKRVNLVVPQRGEKVRLLKMSHQNAELLLEEYLRQKERRRELIPSMVEQLQNDLRLPIPPRRIEAFDISNIQGTNPVGSMVCFIDGVAKKNEYRKYKIKTVYGIDDVGMMREVIYRRYFRLKNENASLPDLVLVDGGKGQLGMAVSALRALELTYLPVVGLAKRLEEIFLPGYPEPQSIPKTSPGLILLRRIRNEAHRFAVSFHRQRRKKSMTQSVFDEIKGVGPVTRNRLFTYYENIQTIAAASIHEISDRIGVRPEIAKKIISKAKSFASFSGKNV